MNGLIVGKLYADGLKAQVVALGAAGKVQRTAAGPLGGIVGKGAAVHFAGGINAVGVIAAPLCAEKDSAAMTGCRVIGKGVGLALVNGAVRLQSAQRNRAVFIEVAVGELHRAAVTGTVVLGKGVGRKDGVRIAARMHSTATHKGVAYCRRCAVAGKGAAVNIQANAGIGAVGLLPGRNCAAPANGGVAGEGAVLHVEAGRLHRVRRGADGVDLDHDRTTCSVVAGVIVIGGRVPVKSAAFHCVNRVELGSFAVGVGVVHCARVAQGRVAPKGTVFQRVFLDIAVKGNRAAAQGRIVAVQGGFFLGIFLLGGGGLGLAEGHVLDGVVGNAVKGGVKGQRTAVGIGTVIGKGAAVERNRHLHQDVVRLDMQGVLVGQVQRTAVLGGMVARKGHVLANGGLYTGAQVDRTAKAARVVVGKVGTFQREQGCVMHVQGRAVAVGFAVGDGGAALHGKAGVHAVAVFTLELFELIGVVRVLQRFLIFAQSNIELAVGIHGGGALYVHTRAGACVGKVADGRAIQREGAAQLYLHAAGGSAAVGRLDGAALNGERAKHGYADRRIGGHCQRGVGHS